MIKVYENGVPLVAIARVEFDPVRLVYHPRAKREPTACNHFPGHRMRMPLLKLPMSEAEARRLRDEWRKAWPEVAAYWDEK